MLKPAVVFFITLITVAVLAAIVFGTYMKGANFAIFLVVEALIILILVFAFLRSRKNNVMNQK